MAGGASVSFMASLSRGEAEAFFEKVLEGVERGERSRQNQETHLNSSNRHVVHQKILYCGTGDRTAPQGSRPGSRVRLSVVHAAQPAMGKRAARAKAMS